MKRAMRSEVICKPLYVFLARRTFEFASVDPAPFPCYHYWAGPQGPSRLRWPQLIGVVLGVAPDYVPHSSGDALLNAVLLQLLSERGLAECAQPSQRYIFS
jgi:hypothetical protein